MLTLLFVLFVVLFSMSSVDQKKFAQLAAGLSNGFGAHSVAFQGNQSTLDGNGNKTQVVKIDPGANPNDGSTGTSGVSRQQQDAVARALQAADRAKASANATAAAKSVEDMKKIEQKITDA